MVPDGYVFVGNYEGLSLTKPAKNRNMWDVQDENGVKIVQELIAKARSGGGFVEYVMPKFKGLPSDPKLSFAEKIDDWQWYVGAGIYMDEINTVLDQKRAGIAKTDPAPHDMLIAFTLAGVVGITLNYRENSLPSVYATPLDRSPNFSKKRPHQR